MAGGVQFALGKTQARELMAWTAAGTEVGFLVIDRSGNGLIDDGTELFSQTSFQPGRSRRGLNGFNALLLYDTPGFGGNGDGAITSADDAYRMLRIWVDRNHNGVSEPDELLTLEQGGIARISLDYKIRHRTDAFGNRFRYFSDVTFSDGHVVAAWDVYLRMDRSR